jgi:hypothetical protein
MKQKVTSGFSVLVGLAIGIFIAYFGLKAIFTLGMKMMRRDASEHFALVEVRLQRMADGALELEKVIADLGWKGSKRTFLEVENLRSLLAGNEDLTKKAEWAVELEHQLLDAQDLWEKVGARTPKIARDYYYQEHVRWWTNESRWLAREEALAKQAFDHYNQLIRKRPFKWVARKYSLQKVAQGALEAAQNKPDKEEAVEAKATTFTAKPVVEPLPTLVFENKAEWPEEFYSEVQYRPMPSMLEVHEGEGEPQLERDQNKKAFEKIDLLKDKKIKILKDKK